VATPERRGRRVGLTREQVLAEALALLDADGVRAFSLRKLAARLDVDPMTIYWHVKGKEEILDGVVALVFADVVLPDRGAWWQRVAEAVRAHREVLHAHPAVLDLLLSRPVRSAAAWSGGEQLLTLLEPRLGSDEAARWLRILASFVKGFLLTERRELGLVSEPPMTEALAHDRPRVAEAMAHLAERSQADFEAGLAVLVGALRRQARKE
jgi:AcrR family transcriptional regulator